MGSKNSIKGKYMGRWASANIDDIAFLEWKHEVNRTYLHFSSASHSYYFEDVKPAELLRQVSGRNKQYLMHCRNKNYINILHFSGCTEDRNCSCQYENSSIDCSCNSAKKINRKLDELRTS